MVSARSNNGWVIWFSLVLALLLSVAPMPTFMEVGRPLWPALLLTYWTLALPHRVGMTTAWLVGIAQDVLYGTLLGQNALILALITFLVLALHQRLRMFPMWQQSLVLMVVFGLAQLVQLWLNALTGNRPPTLLFLLPALVSALLWPWIFAALRGRAAASTSTDRAAAMPRAFSTWRSPSMATLHLASGSPRRRELLAQIGVPFQVLSAAIDESVRPGETAEHYVERLAREKAAAGLAALGDAAAGTRVLGPTPRWCSMAVSSANPWIATTAWPCWRTSPGASTRC